SVAGSADRVTLRVRLRRDGDPVPGSALPSAGQELVPGGASSSRLSACCIWSSPSLRMDMRKSTAQLQTSYVSENSLDLLMHVALNLPETYSVPGC
uniref:Methyl-CpG binding domain protein 3 n=1 Tax=Macaca mulatta TaxID=9544 RepID=A0A5F7ZJJ8_MACMU